MPDMIQEQEVCMSNASNNNACTCSYTGSFDKEFAIKPGSNGSTSPNNSYKIAASKSVSTLNRIGSDRNMERDNSGVRISVYCEGLNIFVSWVERIPYFFCGS